MKGRRNKSRDFAIATLVLAIVLLACGCGKRRLAGPEVLQELTVAISTDVDNWYLDRFPDGDARFVWAQVYETLVRLNTDLKLGPGLATSWKSSDEGKVWTFQLREDVRFHDGTPCHADAVAFSYGPHSYAARTVLRPVQRVEVVDDHTVRFVLARPLFLPYYLTHVGWPVMAPSCVNSAGEFTTPIGSGPFRFESQENEQHITLVRNDNHWGPASTLTRITFRVIPDATARVMALEAGGVDMVVKVPEAEVARLERKTDIVVHCKTSTFTDFIQFNCQKPPFDDVHVRRAVAHAIDTELLTATVLEGIGEPARGRPYSPVMLYANPDLKLPAYDPTRSRALLARAGWRDTDGDGLVEKDSSTLSPTLMVTTNPNVAAGGRFVAMAEAIQGQLRQVGIAAKIQLLEGGAFLRAEGAGDFDMLLRTGFFVWGSYPRHFFIHHSQNLYSHIRNAEFDQLITRADATVDPQQQRRLYYRLQQMTLDLLPAFYLVHQEKVIAASSRVGGYEISAEAPWLNLQDVYIKAPP